MARDSRAIGSGADPGLQPARYWAVDLHVHTPASADVLPDRYGASSPEGVVAAAIEAGLDAIAITDHNTVSWCGKVAEAAASSSLTVLPGVEISTSEGHLLAIWEVGTDTDDLEDVLTTLGINRKQQGRVEVSSPKSIATVAEVIAQAGGLAIAAHIDRERGLLKIPVADHLKRALLTPGLAALEIADRATEDKVRTKLKGERTCAFTQGSDVFHSGGDTHELSAIGRRRTWIKASQPDLIGLRHSLKDPALRVRLDEPEGLTHCWIKSLNVNGGFLSDQTLRFSGDLNCLLGGTGAGKSLALELLRFALDDQVDNVEFAKVREEVNRRLDAALGTDSYVEVTLTLDGDDLVVRRVYDSEGSPAPEIVSGHTEADWRERARIRAFSQGEVIEYAREPVGRLQLIDSALDLEPIEYEIEAINELLHANGDELRDHHQRIAESEEDLRARADVKKRVKELSALFKAEIVQQQGAWAKESGRFTNLLDVLDDSDNLAIETTAAFNYKVEIAANGDLYERAEAVVEKYVKAIDRARGRIATARAAALKDLKEVASDWRSRHDAFEAELSAELAKVEDDERDLSALRRRLKQLQGEEVQLEEVDRELRTTLRPHSEALMKAREQLTDRLVEQRRKRRDLRRERVKALNRLMRGAVRIRLDEESDGSRFRDELARLAKGSGFSNAHLDLLSAKASPIRLVQAFLANTPKSVANATGVPEPRIRVLFDHIMERDRVDALYDLQALDIPDALGVQFRKPETETYDDIENLAHGQKCTAILVIAMADGTEPLIIDQPEDALHAPWIEEHLVSRLRGMRGQRQYIFATRSPGLVVSADAEMIIALEASVDRGKVMESGSLERHNLNKQTLYHLEGGAEPFKRRTEKLSVSLQAQR